MNGFSNPFKSSEDELLVEKEEGSAIINFNSVLFMGTMNHALNSEKSKNNIYKFLLTKTYLYYLKEKPVKNKSTVKVTYKGKIKIGFTFAILLKIKVKEDKTNYYLKITKPFKKVVFKIASEKDALYWEKILAPYTLSIDFLERFENLNLIGFGSFSAVYRVRDKKTKQIFACKRVKLKNLGKDGVKKLVREIEMLRTLNGHNNIPKLYYIFKSNSSVYIVTEYCNGGQIVGSGSFLNETNLRLVADSFLSFLSYLEKESIVIGNIFAPKVLWKSKSKPFENNTIKLVNFNMARKADPEEKVFTHKRDIYRFGELLYIGMTGQNGINFESSLLDNYDGTSSKFRLYKKMLEGNDNIRRLISG